MEEFVYLTDEELEGLSNNDRRDYLKRKKNYENQKMVQDVLDQDDPSTPSKETVNTPKRKGSSNAGRKKVAPAKKKQQIMLTIKPDSLEKLKDVDEDDFKKLLGRYIDKNIDEIVSELEKL